MSGEWRMSALFVVAPGVIAALAGRRAIVALETTLVTHGLPPPEGIETALALEAAVLESGAVPATIGVLDGAVRVGMSRAEIQRLARTADVAKLNPGNLGAGVASRRPGSTTVAATMLAACRAGIRVFATGGIGGVHRNASETGDVSADLHALARWPVAVVCAGAKAILDLPRTVEALESLGVPVFGYRTSTFPAFYRRDSGLRLDARFDEMSSLADAVRVHFHLDAGTGVVVANPVPEAHEMPADVYERSLATALADAARAGVRGRDVTPFLLDRLRVLTEGVSVFSNRALLVDNARVAGQLAVALAERA